MPRSRSVEPFTGPELSDYLVRQHGAVFVRQVGNHLHYKLPTGVTVGSAHHGHITSVLARRIADRLGISYGQLRSDLGYPVVKSSKARSKPTRTSAPGIRKSDVLDAVQACRDAIDEIDRAVRPGIRDEAHYRRALEALATARRPLETFVSQHAVSV